MVETWKIFEYWLPKIAALFSMGGSSIIVAEIYQDWKGKRNSRTGISTISQALLSMSCGDIIFSFAWFIASWVVSQSEDVLVSFEATQTSWGCRFQGFMIQFGFYASLCSNASLAIIYLLLMRYQCPSERLSYYFKRAACIIWLFSLALGIIPLFLDLYHDTGGFCWLSPPPSDAPECQDPASFAENSEICSERRDITNILMFMQILPVWICIFIDGRIMCVIYRLTKNMEEQSEANAFFGLGSGRSILARFTQSRSRVPPSSNVDAAADNKLPKARAFFGFASSAAEATTQQQNNNDVEQALPPKSSGVTNSTQFDDASASEACTVFSDEQTGMNASSRRRSNLGIMMSSALESLAEEVSNRDDDDDDLHPTESFDSEPETLERPPEQALDQTSSPQNKKRSRTVAIQGLWYIGGFFVTFLVSTMSLVYFMVMGEWSAPLYRASYFFMAGQGAFNFIVFAKGRRDMKTTVGGRVKKMLCFLSCKCLPNDITPPSPPVSSSTPQKQKLSGPHETQSTMSGSANSARTPKHQTILRSDMSTEVHNNHKRVSMISGVSNASTVVASNQNLRLGRASSLISIAEDAIPQDIKEQVMQKAYASDILLSGFESTASEAPDDFGNKAMIGESEASVCSSHEEEDEVEDQILEELPRPAAQNPTGRCKDDRDYDDEYDV